MSPLPHRLTRRAFLRALGLGALGVLSVEVGANACSGRDAPRKEPEPAAFDSGARAVGEAAEALTGRGQGILEAYPPGSFLFLGLLSLLPEPWRVAGLDWGISLGAGAPPTSAASLNAETLFSWCVRRYPNTEMHPTIVVGSPNGAAAHLAALLRAPLLTGSLLLAFRRPSTPPDDVAKAQEHAEPLLEALTRARNATAPWEAVHHVDPVHDRLLVKHLALIRVKLHALPEVYSEFIRERLEPGGTLVLINCVYRWPQYRLSDEAYVQVGGLGGVSPAEYRRRWTLSYPLEVRRESEWGCPEPFAESVRAFAAREGFELLEIRLDHPWAYSRLAYRAYLACEGVRNRWVFLDCFTHQNPRTNVRTGIPGLWLPFNTEDAFEQAEAFLKDKDFERIYLALVPSIPPAPDTVPLERWQALLSEHGRDVRLVGIRPRSYPADPIAPFCFWAAVEKLRRRLARKRSLTLKPSALKGLLGGLAGRRSESTTMRVVPEG